MSVATMLKGRVIVEVRDEPGWDQPCVLEIDLDGSEHFHPCKDGVRDRLSDARQVARILAANHRDNGRPVALRFGDGNTNLIDPEYQSPKVHISDGGREAAGFSVNNDAGDCVTRAIVLASGLPYSTVYHRLAAISAEMGGPRSARDGVKPKVYKKWFAEHGWVWTPTMHIGSGCTVHLREGELPTEGCFVVRLSGHLCALVDGEIWDNGDPCRDGTRCVYGLWKAP